MSEYSEENTLSLEGEVTIYTAEEIKQELFDALKKQQCTSVNLGDVSEFDTAGFQALLFGKVYAEQNGIELRLEAPSGAVEEVFSLYAMNELLEKKNGS